MGGELFASLGLDQVETPDYDNWWVSGNCRFGCCVEFRCPVCNEVQAGWGPVGCPCQNDGVPHVPVKSNVAGRRPSRRRPAARRK